jgi:hypothetical protein
MVLLIFAAILGAVLGLTLRPAVLAICVSLAVSGGLQGVIGLVCRLATDDPAQRALVARIDALVGIDVHAIWPVLAAAGIGSLSSAVMWSFFNKQPTDRYWFRRAGRRLKLMDQVEERPVHTAAESRFHDILGR